MDADGSGSTGVIILYGVNSFANLLANCKSSIRILDAGVWKPFCVGLGWEPVIKRWAVGRCRS